MLAEATATAPVAAALARQRKLCCYCADAAGDTGSICIPLHKCSGAPKIWELNLVLAEATATAPVAAALARQRKICCCCADAAGATESICIPLHKYSGAPKIGS